MKIKIWGARGSIPAPLRPEAVESKLFRAIRGMPPLDTSNEDAVWEYIHNLPPLLRGTIGGNTACVEARADGNVFAMDAGSGLYQMGLELMQGPFGRGEGTLHLFISHAHWDHIQGFTMFKPALVPGNRIFIYGTHDLKTVYDLQQHPLTWPVSLSYMAADIQFVHVEPGQSFNIGKVRVESIKNAHPGDAYSYRLEDQHSVFVYASDAEYKQLEDNVVNPYVNFFRNADALIFDAMYTLQDAWLQEDYGHSSALIGVDLAHAAGVKRLILFHHDPTYSDEEIEKIYAAAVKYQQQKPPPSQLKIIIACEGEVFDLTPPGAVDLQLSPNGETAILTATSIFDERGIDELERQFSRLHDEYSASNSIIDLAQVETFTTASLKSLFALRQKWKNRPIILASPPENIQEIIKLGGYEDSFAIYPTVNAALAAVRTREALNLPGQIIQNRYKIETKIGDGPLGTVLRATDMHTNQVVALKILSPTFSHDTLQRFMHQARQLVALEHPNILKVFAIEQEGDSVFQVEEFVDAPNLGDFLAHHNPVREHTQNAEQNAEAQSPLLAIALDVLSALEYAHSRGIILGDLKPNNIFLTEQGARLNDFGLGKLIEGRNLLETPHLFLNAHYVSPEQILGQPLDARTDLYAFGVILYQLFTGHLPFEETTASKTGKANAGSSDAETEERAVMLAHLRQAPRHPRELNPQISISLDHVIFKLLAQNPNDRYANALQVHRILSSLFSNIENVTRPRIQLLVGREKHAQTLRAQWQDVTGGHGQLAFITGEAGIGKSRLAQQVAAQCHPPVLLIGRCKDTAGHSACALFTEILRDYLSTVPPEFFDADARQQLSNFAPLLPEIHQMLPDLHVPPPLDPRQEQLRLMASLVQFIRQATQERPWFIILEDLQWADRSSLELLLYLGRNLPTLPVFIIGTYRDTELHRDHPLHETLRRLKSHPTYRIIRLERLTKDEVGQVLTFLWALDVPEALVQRIYEHTAGNPFYVEEIAKGLADEGFIPASRDDIDPEWYLRALTEIHLPHSARESVWRRVARLSNDTQALLRQAAVLGQTFRFDDLQKMAELPEWDVLERLDEALEQQLIEEVQGGSALRFRQKEIQVVIYNDLGQLRRRLLHRKAGEALESRAGADTSRLAEELAYHFGEAGQVTKAVQYSMQAARQAQLAHANETALQWYTRVLNMLDTPTNATASPMRLRALQSAGEVLTLIGHYDEALEYYTQAIEATEIEATTKEQRRQLAELCYLSATVYELKDEYDTALMWLNSGLNYIRNDGPTVEAAHIYLLGARIYGRRREDTQAIAWCEKSLNIATQIPTREGLLAIAAALYTQVGIKSRQGNLKQAVHLCLESIRAYHEIGDPAGESNAYTMLGNAYDALGNWELADEAYEKGLAIKKEIGDIYGEAVITNNHGMLHAKRGDWESAHKLYEHALTIWRQVAVSRGEAATLNNMVQVYIHRQEWSQAHQALNRSQTLLSEIDSKEYLPELERMWGEYYLAIGDIDEATAHTRRAIELASTYHDPAEECIAYRILGQIHMQNAAYREAEIALNDSLNILNTLADAYETARTKLELVRLSIIAGCPPRQTAHKLLLEASKAFEKLGAQEHLAQAQKLQQHFVTG